MTIPVSLPLLRLVTSHGQAQSLLRFHSLPVSMDDGLGYSTVDPGTSSRAQFHPIGLVSLSLSLGVVQSMIVLSPRPIPTSHIRILKSPYLGLRRTLSLSVCYALRLYPSSTDARSAIESSSPISRRINNTQLSSKAPSAVTNQRTQRPSQHR